VAVFPVRKDGSLEEASGFVQHKGSSINRDRQEGPHGHAVEMSPDNRFALVADLGLDQVLVYPFDAARGTLGQAQVYKVKPGCGPRHLVFSPDGRFVYLINEMASAITVFAYQAAGGKLSELQTVSTLRKGFAGASDAAEIAIHPSGSFLYASNRGEDSIAVFSVDRAKGTLTAIENVPTQGKTPRNFALDPSGFWLLVGNQESNSIVAFRIHSKTGRLLQVGQVVHVASPVCITFVAPSRASQK
jgi:6-phosphogluconolactonase